MKELIAQRGAARRAIGWVAIANLRRRCVAGLDHRIGRNQNNQRQHGTSGAAAKVRRQAIVEIGAADAEDLRHAVVSRISDGIAVPADRQLLKQIFATWSETLCPIC
jgi:hypothetical protein